MRPWVPNFNETLISRKYNYIKCTWWIKRYGAWTKDETTEQPKTKYSSFIRSEFQNDLNILLNWWHTLLILMKQFVLMGLVGENYLFLLDNKLSQVYIWHITDSSFVPTFFFYHVFIQYTIKSFMTSSSKQIYSKLYVLHSIDHVGDQIYILVHVFFF